MTEHRCLRRRPFTPTRAAAALAILVLAIGLVAAPGAARAQSLDQARASGMVGERYDGFAVVRQANAPAAVRQLVDQVNGQRSQIYAKRAAEQRVPKEQVGQLYARQIAESAPGGTWFLLQNGQWQRK